MSEDDKRTTEANSDEIKINLEIYKLLIGYLQHCHSRLVDNYRVFLTFNSLLIPAVTALLVYVLKNRDGLSGNDLILLRLAVTLICLLSLEKPRPLGGVSVRWLCL